MKKLLALLVVASVLCVSAIPALATEKDAPIEIAPIATEGRIMGDVIPDLLVESVTRGTSVPTDPWDLDNNPYPWSISGLRGRIYTNYLFRPNPDTGAMRVETSLDRDYAQGPTTYVVNLYTKSGTWVYTSTVDTGDVYLISYDDLDPDTQYYVCWEYAGGQGRTLSGGGWVEWLY